MANTSKLTFILRAFIPSVYFNFKYLPFKQAIKLPILTYKPHFNKLKGKIIIDSHNVYTGMIRLGIFASAMYNNTGFSIKHEGTIVFKGKCRIGNNTNIVCGRQGKIVFGEDFVATAGVKILSQCGITFGKETSLGWGTIVMDTNSHMLYDIEKKKFKKAFGKINIGSNNWFAAQCMIMPSVTTLEHCIFGARTIVTRGGQYESYCVHGGNPVRVLTRNVMRIIGQEFIKDYSIE